MPALAFSSAARRRAALIGAPLLVLSVVGALFASGAFDGAPPQGTADPRALVAPGTSGGSSGPGALANGIAGTASSPASASVSASGSAQLLAGGATSSTGATAGRGAPSGGGPGAGAGGGATPAAGGNAGTAAGGSSAPAVIAPATTAAKGGGAPTSAPTSAHPAPSASPTATDSGWICRSGGFKVDGALSEDPCIRDDDGTLMLEGELKGSYDSSVVVVVRVDYNGSYSSARISPAVTPAALDGKTFGYEVAIGSWAPNEVITCQENVDPASDKTDYEYTSNSADLRT